MAGQAGIRGELELAFGSWPLALSSISVLAAFSWFIKVFSAFM